MNNEIVRSVLGNKESLEAYFALVNSQRDIIEDLIKMLKEQVEEIAHSFNLKVYYDRHLSECYSGFQLATSLPGAVLHRPACR
jgi:hypothetical protein